MCFARYETPVILSDVGMSGAALNSSAEHASVHRYEPVGRFGAGWYTVGDVEVGLECGVAMSPTV